MGYLIFWIIQKVEQLIHNPMAKRGKIFRSKPVIIFYLGKGLGLLVQYMEILIKDQHFFGGFANIKNQRNGLLTQCSGVQRNITKNLKYWNLQSC